MNLGVLHISDLHFKRDTNIDKSLIMSMIKKMENSLDSNDLIIIVSGDIAFSGKKVEYDVAKAFFGNFINILNNSKFKKRFKVYFVPGNHDINYQDENVNRKKLNKLFNTNDEINKELNKFLSWMGNYFNFSDYNNCFSNNKLLDKKFIRISKNKIKVKVNLINTAPFSTFKDIDNDNDKGVHYLKPEIIDEIKKHNNEDFSITVMHHNYDWFHETVKDKLRKGIELNSSILLVGHEHNSIGVNEKKTDSLIILKAGAFDAKYGNEFSLLDIDFSSRKMKYKMLRYDEGRHIYSELSNNNYDINMSNHKLKPSNQFLKDLRKDQSNEIEDIKSIFTFPYLVKKSNAYEEEVKIENYNEFINRFNSREILQINGGNGSGKTTLLNYLYEELSMNKVPLLLKIENFHNESPEKMLKESFKEQYSDINKDYELFNTLPKNQKVLLIDDLTSIKEEYINRFLVKLKDIFSKIVFTSNERDKVDVLREIKSELNDEEFIDEFQIKSLTHNKRLELIKKFVELQKLSINPNKVNNKIGSNIAIFGTTPDFVVSYLNALKKGVRFENQKSSNIFSSVFETKLRSNILNIINEKDLDETLMVLQKIAYYIHQKKKYPLELSEIINVINDYNSEYGLKINIQCLIQSLLETKTLINVDHNKYKFYNINYLAYFISGEIIRRYNEDRNSTQNDIEYLLNNLCFEINSNILLYMALRTQNTSMIMFILEKAHDYYNEWESFNFDSGTLKFLKEGNLKDNIDAPTKKDREKIDNNIDDTEKSKVEELEKLEHRDIYDFSNENVNSLFNKIIIGMKYLETIARILPEFNYTLKVKEKDRIVNNIYNYNNKLFQKFFSQIDDNYNLLLKEIKEEFANNSKSFDEQKFKSWIVNFSLTSLLSFYDFTARYAVTEKTIDSFLNFKPSKSNDKIQRLIFAENELETKEFSRIADDVYDNAKNFNIKILVKKIVKKHFLFRDINPQNQSIIDKYLGPKEKKRIMMNNKTNSS